MYIITRAGYGCYSQCAARTGPDRICLIELPASDSVPFFPKKARITLCKTDPDPIWMAWSGFSQTHLVRKQAGVQESSGPVSGRVQPASYQFSTFSLGSVLPHTSRIITITVQNRPGFYLVLADCVRFWPNRSGPEASRCARIIRSGSGQRLKAQSGSDANRIRHIYWAAARTFGCKRMWRVYRYRRSRCWQAGEKRLDSAHSVAPRRLFVVECFC